MPELKKEEEEDETKMEEFREIGDQMDDDFDLGKEIKDQLIPLALEYYMGVIEDDEDDEEHDH